jgi:hypothetical protein
MSASTVLPLPQRAFPRQRRAGLDASEHPTRPRHKPNSDGPRPAGVCVTVVPRSTPSRAARTNPRRVRRAVLSVIGGHSCPTPAHPHACTALLSEGSSEIRFQGRCAGTGPGRPEAHPPSNPRELEGCAWLRAVVRPQLESTIALGIRAASFHTRHPRVSCTWVCKHHECALGRERGRTESWWRAWAGV